MRAFAVRDFGDAPVVMELPPPVPDGMNDLLVRIACAGMNPIDHKRVDWLTAEGRFPHVPGIDFAGTIERVPAGEHEYQVGDRVFGMARRTGTYAQAALVSRAAPGEALAPIPHGIGFEQAAALPVAGVTALGGLHLLDLRPGQLLVILGAAGGVGGYAVPLARIRGVRVIAATRGGVGETLRLGAHEVLDTGEGDVIDRIALAHPGGVDAVLDLVSDGDAIRRVAGIIRPGGRLVSAQRSADLPSLVANGITGHNIAAADNPKATRTGLEELAAAVLAGVIEPRIAFATDLDRAADALERLRRGGLGGKAVIRVAASTRRGG